MVQESTPVSKNNLEHRVAATEVGIAGLSRDVSNLVTTLSTYAAQTTASIERLSSQIAEGRQTSWSTLASWAAVIIAVVSLGMSGFIKDLGRLETLVVRNQDRYLSHVVDGHPKRIEENINFMREANDMIHKDQEKALAIDKFDAATDRNALDLVLQREIRSLESKFDKVLEQLDERIDRIEMRMSP